MLRLGQMGSNEVKSSATSARLHTRQMGKTCSQAGSGLHRRWHVYYCARAQSIAHHRSAAGAQPREEVQQLQECGRQTRVYHWPQRSFQRSGLPWRLCSTR